MCLHLFAISEAYHEQIGLLPSLNGSLDIALSNVHTWSWRQRNTIGITIFWIARWTPYSVMRRYLLFNIVLGDNQGRLHIVPAQEIYME